jgi:hypothetical protein
VEALGKLLRLVHATLESCQNDFESKSKSTRLGAKTKEATDHKLTKIKRDYAWI